MNSIPADILWRGRIDRISGQGNAMIKPTHTLSYAAPEQKIEQEINIGPLSDSAVGETVVFTWDSGAFGLCLEDRFVSESYFEEWYSRPNYSISKSTATSATVTPNHEQSLPTGTVCTATPLAGENRSIEPEKSVIKLIPEDTTEIDTGVYLGVLSATVPPAKVPQTVRVTGYSGGCAIVEPKPLTATKDLPSIGDECTVQIETTSDIGTICIYQGTNPVRVVIRDIDYPTGETITVQITAHHDYYLSAEPVFSINDIDNPIPRSEISLDDPETSPWTIKNGIPIKIRPLTSDISHSTELLVVDTLEFGLLGVWDVRSTFTEDDLSVGTTIELTIDSVTTDRLVGLHHGFPVVCFIDQPLPYSLEGHDLTVVIKAVAPDRATAHLKTPPFNPGTQVSMDTFGQTESHHFGRAGGHLIRVAKSEGITFESPFRVAIESIGEISEASVERLQAIAKPPNAEQPAYIRLPKTVDSTQWVDGIPVDTSALPDVSAPVTLGIEAWASDHLVPSVEALPTVEMPSVGDIVSVQVGEQTNNRFTSSVSNGLPLELLSPASADLTQTYAQVVEQNKSNLRAVATVRSGDNRSAAIVELVAYTSRLLQASEYASAQQVLSIVANTQLSEQSLIKVVSQARYAILTANNLFTDNPESAVQSTLQEVHNKISSYDADNVDNGESHLLRAYKLELEAILKCVEAYSQAREDTDTSLQAIARGAEGTKPIASAIQKLRESAHTLEETTFHGASPSPELLYFIRRFEDEFPYLLNNLQVWLETYDTGKPPEEWITEILLPTTGNIESAESIFEISAEHNEPESLWKRPDPAAAIVIDESTFDTLQETPPEPGVDPKPNRTTTGGGTSSSPSESSDDTKPTSSSDGHPSTPDSPPVGCSIQSASSTDTAESDDGSNQDSTISTLNHTDSTASDNNAQSTSISGGDDELPVASPELRRLRQAAEADATETPVTGSTSTSSGGQYHRSQKIRDYALTRANGHCEACGAAAPFSKPTGEPFLEVHHVNELGDGGADRPELVVAVCPNCHREIHYGKDGDRLNETLREKLAQGLGDVGSS